MNRSDPPLGSTLLDQSTAKPGSVNMDIFSPKAKPLGQGTVSSDYQERCDQEDPWPPESSEAAGKASLSNCRITTAPDKLATDQPFEMAVEVTVPAGVPANQVSFRLQCLIVGSDGSEKPENTSAAFSAKTASGTATASGTLHSPKSPVESGTTLRYWVSAQHPNADQALDSSKFDVEAYKPPEPLAIWSLGAVHFGFDSSFIVPAAAAQIAEFKKIVDQHPKAGLAVFGHADPVGDDEPNKLLSGRRAYAVYCLLTKHAPGWVDLSQGVAGDSWGLATTQSILAHLAGASGPYYGGSVDGVNGPKTEAAIKAFQKDNGLQVDGVVGPRTKEKLYQSYLDKICPLKLGSADFVGLPSDELRQWACVGCGELNPVLVFSQADADAYKASNNKSKRDAANAPNRRATVILFPESAKGPGRVNFPCPTWKDGTAKCKAKLFPDADKRRNPSEAQRTWETDKDTFGCKFYAGIALERAAGPGAGTGWSLEFDAALTHFSGLAKKMSEPEFVLWCSNCFGVDLRTKSFKKLRSDLLAGTVPPVKYVLVEGGVKAPKGDATAEAGYQRPEAGASLDTAAIHLDTALAQAAWDDADSGLPAWKLYNLLTHEFGHHLDYLLRFHYETAAKDDADRDEGAMFAYALIPLELDKANFHEVATLHKGGESKRIVAPLDLLAEAVERFSGEDVQNDEQKEGLFEFFSPGMGKGTCSWGHKKIEVKLALSQEWKFDEKGTDPRQDNLYFGNWLRDFSQVVDPLPLGWTVQGMGFNRKTLTAIVNFMSFKEFVSGKQLDAPQGVPRRRQDFLVDTDRLGLYRPEEHMDNPCGIKATDHDTGFRSACPPDSPELQPDPHSWVSLYLIDPTYDETKNRSTLKYVEHCFEAALDATNEIDFLRNLGGALHSLEDLYAHSNFLELTLRTHCGRTGIVPWVAESPTIGTYPLVTGSFGPLDTVCSLVYVVADLWEKCANATSSKEQYSYLRLLSDFLMVNSMYKFAKNLAVVLQTLEAIAAREDELERMVIPEGVLKFAKEKARSAAKILLHNQVAKLVRSGLLMMSKQITQLLIEGLLTMAKNIDEFQTSQLTTKPGYPNVPTHTQLAKDHDDHPLHDLSAQCAEVLALRIGKRVFEHRNAGRKGAAPVADLMRIAKGYIFHPAKDQVGADAEVLGLRKEILDLIESWAKAPANQAGLKRLETASWPIEQNGRSKKSIEEIRTRFAPYQKLAQATLQAERVASRTQECLECVV